MIVGVRAVTNDRGSTLSEGIGQKETSVVGADDSVEKDPLVIDGHKETLLKRGKGGGKGRVTKGVGGTGSSLEGVRIDQAKLIAGLARDRSELEGADRG